MNNNHQYGFRFHSWRSGKVAPLVKGVATAQNDQDDTSTYSICLSVGDPVKLVSTGGVTIAHTTDEVYGIIWGVKQYWDGAKMRSGGYLPNQTTWGTVESRRSELFIMPAKACYWEIDCDDAVTATTRAAYHALIGENVVHTIPSVAWGSTYKADPYIDISGHATTHTFEWRLEGISDTAENRDFAGTYVKMIVSVNRSEEAASPTTMYAGV